MTGAQVRAARQALGLKIKELAKLAGLPTGTVGVFERTNRMQTPLYGRHDRLSALRNALEALGVKFGPDRSASKLEQSSE